LTFVLFLGFHKQIFHFLKRQVSWNGILPKKSVFKGNNLLSEIKSKDCRFDEKNIQVEHVIRNNKRTIKVDKSATVKDCKVSCFRNNDTLVYVIHFNNASGR